MTCLSIADSSINALHVHSPQRHVQQLPLIISAPLTGVIGIFSESQDLIGSSVQAALHWVLV